MNVGQINYHDVANGPGIRVAIFVTGCTLACEGCFNAELQDRNAGRPFTLADHAKIIDTLGKPYIAGITLLGGDPMQNTKGLVPLVQDIRKEFGAKKNIWCFSGYTWERSSILGAENNSPTCATFSSMANSSNPSTATIFSGGDPQTSESLTSNKHLPPDL